MSRSTRTPSPEQERAWAEQWRLAARALAEQKARELADLTKEEALRAADSLLGLATPPYGEGRWSQSGLVELQRAFRLLARRESTI